MLWIIKYKMNFSFEKKVEDVNRMIKEIVIISKFTQNIKIDLKNNDRIGETIKIRVKIFSEDHVIYKKISLSMGYESNSFFSLSYLY